MRCIQSTKIAKSLIQIECTGKQLLFADSRLNCLLMDNPSKIDEDDQIQIEENYPIYEFTRKDT